MQRPSEQAAIYFHVAMVQRGAALKMDKPYIFLDRTTGLWTIWFNRRKYIMAKWEIARKQCYSYDYWLLSHR